MTVPAAEIRDIQVSYQGKLALDVRHLVVEAGRTLTIIGPNGSGKSTFLRVLALLERPARGHVLHRGERVGAGARALGDRRRVALVMQEPILRNASVRENVATGLRFRRVGRADIRRRVDEWLERLGISHLAGRNARSLSGGEAQRASIARALVLEPELLLLDEPLAGLDPPTRMALLEDLQRLLHRVESATVFVTHDRAEAQALGDRLAVLMGGRLRQEGSPEEVFSTPSSEEVAAFVGVENILAGRVDRQSGGVATVAVGSNHVSVVGGHALGEKLVVGIRPEAVVLEAQVRQGVVTSALNRLPGTVVRITPLGPLARVSVDCGFPLVSLITGQSVENLSLSPGAGVVASFKASAVHVIRRESGR